MAVAIRPFRGPRVPPVRIGRAEIRSKFLVLLCFVVPPLVLLGIEFFPPERGRGPRFAYLCSPGAKTPALTPGVSAALRAVELAG